MVLARWLALAGQHDWPTAHHRLPAAAGLVPAMAAGRPRLPLSARWSRFAVAVLRTSQPSVARRGTPPLDMNGH